MRVPGILTVVSKILAKNSAVPSRASRCASGVGDIGGKRGAESATIRPNCAAGLDDSRDRNLIRVAHGIEPYHEISWRTILDKTPDNLPGVKKGQASHP